MMLPQFGFIVAQAGADSHNLPTPPPAPAPSNSVSALAPLLHGKPFNFGPSSSSNMSTSDVGYYRNNYNSSLPFYSRQPSPPSSHNVIQQVSVQVTPPPPPPPPTSFLYNHKEIMPKAFTPIIEKKKKESTSSVSVSSSPWYRQPPPYYEEELQDQNKWHEKVSTKQEVKEYNDLMTWMDNEFWEQADEIYQEKLLNLQNELLNIQKGTHSAFREMIADYEFKREKTITDAECFMKYQISFIEHYFDQDINALEDEYEIERRHLQDTLITSIEDRRRQIKDDKEENNDNEEGNNVRTKRTLRKRNADATSLRAEPLSKRRAVRPSTLHNIHSISQIEDEELEAEYLNMKAGKINCN